MTIEKGATPEAQERRIDELLGELSLDEKIFMLSGHGFIEADRRGTACRYCARALRHRRRQRAARHPAAATSWTVPRGVGHGRAPPASPSPWPGAPASTWSSSAASATPSAGSSAPTARNLFGGVCINLLRHPAWGRAQETYGEDPFLLGEMGAALTRGVQHHNVVATPKHFACQQHGERPLHRGRGGRRARRCARSTCRTSRSCLDAGAGAVMSRLQPGERPRTAVTAAPCSPTILKGDWGFEGHVYSDFVMGCRGARRLRPPGLDVEAPDTIHFGREAASTAVRRGRGAGARASTTPCGACCGACSAPCSAAEDPETLLGRVGHRLRALTWRWRGRPPEKSLVLLKQRRTCCRWSPKRVRGTLLVVGALADVPNLGDHGSSRVFPPSRGDAAGRPAREPAPPGWEVVYEAGDDARRALRERAAADFDAVIVVAGYTYEDEGEYIPGAAWGTPEGPDQDDRGRPARPRPWAGSRRR